jgi:superfamily II DNA helicase RecQ
MFAALSEKPIEKTQLQKRLKIDPDVFDKALEKLCTHAGAVLDFEENVTRGDDRWRPAYQLQAEQRSAQIELVIRFSSSNTCRMSTLVRHFGDVADGKTTCGLCDFCAPAACIAQRYRTATEEERVTLFRVLAALRSRTSRATGKLHSELFPAGEVNRDSFENILGAMARAGLLLQADEVFEKDGKRIPFRTVRLTPHGRSVTETSPLAFVMKDTASPVKKTRAHKRKPKNMKGSAKTTATAQAPSGNGAGPGLEEALRAWRLQQAKRRNLPAFRIFNDRVLKGIVSALPRNGTQLSAISGIASNLVKQSGDQICHIVNQYVI